MPDETRRNAFGQPIGAALPGWTARARPPRTPIEGRWCRLEPLVPAHGADLFAAFQEAEDGRDWTYMASERIEDRGTWDAVVAAESASADPLHHAILDRESGAAIGKAAFMRIDPANGVIEIGHIAFSPRLKHTRAASEAVYLLARRAFDELGYRRLEWKCDALNAPSRRAAERFGFVFEGVFRQALVTKQRNRDTAWYSMLDIEWSDVRSAFERWLAPENFDEAGRQRHRLDTPRGLGTPRL